MVDHSFNVFLFSNESANRQIAPYNKRLIYLRVGSCKMIEDLAWILLMLCKFCWYKLHIGFLVLLVRIILFGLCMVSENINYFQRHVYHLIGYWYKSRWPFNFNCIIWHGVYCSKSWIACKVLVQFALFYIGLNVVFAISSELSCFESP